MTSLLSALRGIALGDALGLPHEGLTPARIARRLAHRPLRPMLLPGWLMVSDDTDHACMALLAWRGGGGDPAAFAHRLAWRVRCWFLALPPGIGLATAKAALRLWIGIPPGRSGVVSAGNGPLMRAGILGVALCRDERLAREAVTRSTLLTHTDPRALDAAQVFALACARSAQNGYPTDRAGFVRTLEQSAQTDVMRQRLRELAATFDSGGKLDDFRWRAGWTDTDDKRFRGVSGFAPESLAGALAAFLFAGPDGLAVIDAAVRLGGDADSVASFAGCLAGAATPATFDTPHSQQLLARLRDIPWHASSLDAVANDGRLAPALLVLRLPRNLFQLAVVIGHGVLRAVW